MFPELFGDFQRAPVVQRALKKGAAVLEIVDIREYAGGSFRHIDDSPFGGGAGMVLRAAPVLAALAEARTASEAGPALSGDTGPYAAARVIALTPAGKPFTQKKARELAAEGHIILICGHYEGMDERILRHVDEEISIGDYVLTGGELPAQVIADAVIRLQEGVLRRESTMEESFEEGLLEYPQYTQPADLNGDRVPEVLLSGDHERIRIWRRKASLKRTMERRPDLLKGLALSREDEELLAEIRAEMEGLAEEKM